MGVYIPSKSWITTSNVNSDTRSIYRTNEVDDGGETYINSTTAPCLPAPCPCLVPPPPRRTPPALPSPSFPVFFLVREQRGLTLHCCFQFCLLLILVAKGLYVQKLLDDMLSPLSNLRNSRWRPRWPPLHINDHKFLPVHLRKVIFVSIPRF